jgi:hypothetical protein
MDAVKAATVEEKRFEFRLAQARALIRWRNGGPEPQYSAEGGIIPRDDDFKRLPNERL